MPVLPVKKGDRVTVEIEDMGHSGDGVARYLGYVLFVPFTAPGDEAEVEVISTGSRFGRAVLHRLLKPSWARVRPVCPYFGRCGGCQLQHLDDEAERAQKQKWVTTTLGRIAGLAGVPVGTPRSGPRYGYRERVRLTPVSDDESVTLGFHRADGAGCLPIERCDLQAETNNQVMGALAEHPVVDRQLGGVTLRARPGGTSILFTTRARTIAADAYAALALDLADRIPYLKAVHLKTPADPNPWWVWGDDHLFEAVDGLLVRTSPGVFTQVNRALVPALYRDVIEAGEITSEHTVFDVFSGVGILSALVGRDTGARVMGVEWDPRAVEDAEYNAQLNDLPHVTHYQADAAVGVEALLEVGERPDVILLDPPRSGCSEALLDVLMRASPSRLVYVACHLGTWARDLGYLTEGGWEVARVQPVDLFPQTAHVEVVSVLRR